MHRESTNYTRAMGNLRHAACRISFAMEVTTGGLSCNAHGMLACEYWVFLSVHSARFVYGPHVVYSVYLTIMFRRDFDLSRWSKCVESIRKDVECTFGILKGRFRILKEHISCVCVR